jgi:AraC-like DNA-binding protein
MTDDGPLRHRLVTLLGRLATGEGRTSTPFLPLRLYRSERNTAPDPSVYTPSLCVVAQGAKEARLGGQTYRYDPFHYLVVGAPLPVRANVIEASPGRPFLSLVLDVSTAEVRDLLAEMADGGRPAAWAGAPPLRVSPLDPPLLAAVVRLLEAVGDPVDCRVLAPSILREIVYRALRGDQGDLLRLAARAGGPPRGLARALEFLHRNVDRRVDVATLARTAGMSPSSLHHGFKSATTLTPIQYLKRMRLDRARQLMFEEGCQAAEAALKVGYESPSQFSRDFKRVFGLPPRRYLARLGAAGRVS